MPWRREILGSNEDSNCGTMQTNPKDPQHPKTRGISPSGEKKTQFLALTAKKYGVGEGGGGGWPLRIGGLGKLKQEAAWDPREKESGFANCQFFYQKYTRTLICDGIGQKKPMTAL